jgi:formate dehydrogenase assembly factor FdhD
MAADAGMTLVGFVRDGGMNVYTAVQRVAATTAAVVASPP